MASVREVGMSREIDPNAPLSPCECVCIGTLLLIASVCIAACLGVFR